MMHGQQNVKFCNAKQAAQIYKYKNIKTKLYKKNVAIWYNKTRRLKQITPHHHENWTVIDRNRV